METTPSNRSKARAERPEVNHRRKVTIMCHSYRMIFTLVAAIVVMLSGAQAQDNPYRIEEGWAKFPDGRKWGSTSGVDVDREATSGFSRDVASAQMICSWQLAQTGDS